MDLYRQGDWVKRADIQHYRLTRSRFILIKQVTGVLAVGGSWQTIDSHVLTKIRHDIGEAARIQIENNLSARRLVCGSLINQQTAQVKCLYRSLCPQND